MSSMHVQVKVETYKHDGLDAPKGPTLVITSHFFGRRTLVTVKVGEVEFAVDGEVLRKALERAMDT